MTTPLPFQQSELGCRVEGARWMPLEVGAARAGLHLVRSRRRPWLHEVRVRRFGRGLDRAQVEALVQAFAGLARRKPVIALRVEAFSERPEERAAVAAACRTAGFEPVPAGQHRSYTHTVLVDLRLSEDELLGGFHKTARQNVRAPGKKGLEVRDITDPAAAPRLRTLLEEAFRRTGAARAPTVDWERLLAHAAGPSACVRIAGLFPADREGCADPLSFAVAYLHGDVAEYAHAGSVRDPSIRVSLLYTVAWELMRWAKSRGAIWWDFGGVTAPREGAPDDAREGISGFKRYFSTNVVEVGEEWVLRPGHSLPASLARVLTRW